MCYLRQGAFQILLPWVQPTQLQLGVCERWAAGMYRLVLSRWQLLPQLRDSRTALAGLMMLVEDCVSAC